ncbi:hypothetical protein L3Q82_021328, partial [Scortum barcoo]
MSSGSFPPSEATSYVPISRVLVQGLGLRGPRPRLPPKPHCTWPLMDLPAGGLFCDLSVDGIGTCWPRSAAGELISRPCPEQFNGIHYNTT